MHEPEVTGHPSVGSLPRSTRGVPFKSSRAAFTFSVVAHLVAGYALSRQAWPGASPPIAPRADFFFELPRPAQTPPLPAPEPEQPTPEVREPPRVEPPPASRAPEVLEPAIVVAPPASSEPEPALSPRTSVPDITTLDEARQRAAQEVVAERAAESPYITFSIDDVAPPRPEAEPERKRSIFDGGTDFGGRSVGRVGQQRTKVGRKLAELCNALTGGFGVAFQGLGLFSACASPDDEPSGLFPEVRPAYLDMLPECVDTRDTAPALALESSFPTIKCRMVRQEELE